MADVLNPASIRLRRSPLYLDRSRLDGFVAAPQSIEFTDPTRTNFILVQSRGAPSSWFIRVVGGLAAAARQVPDKATAEFVFDFRPFNGIERPGVARLTVELRPYPQ